MRRCESAHLDLRETETSLFSFAVLEKEVDFLPVQSDVWHTKTEGGTSMGHGTASGRSTSGTVSGTEANNREQRRPTARDLVFNSYGTARTRTATGKDAYVDRNSMNIRRPLYSLRVDGKTLFTRGTIDKVFEYLARM